MTRPLFVARYEGALRTTPCSASILSIPDTLEELQALVDRYGLASEVDILMLCPLDTSFPPFVLLSDIFPAL
jgi:hypothetical protein